jgi:hypothetical protein
MSGLSKDHAQARGACAVHAQLVCRVPGQLQGKRTGKKMSNLPRNGRWVRSQQRPGQLGNIIDKCPQHQREADGIQELDGRVAAKEAETTAGTKGAPAANRGPCTVCGNLVLVDAQIRDADGRYSHEACAVMDEVSSEEEENEDEVSSEENEIGPWYRTLPSL